MNSESDWTKKVGDYWSSIISEKKTHPTSWWESPRAQEHLNYLITGEKMTGAMQGFLHWVNKKSGGRRFGKGLSVGSGTGGVEMEFTAKGMVERFDLYDLSDASLEVGRTTSHARGMEKTLFFHLGDPLQSNDEESVDLIHWSGALHHMSDVGEALAWSKRTLKKGGVLCFQDYVGASRFQWCEENINLANHIRAALPQKFFLRNPAWPEKFFPRKRKPPTLAHMEYDPSEAADSSRILESISFHFPNADIINLGGAAYQLVLDDCIRNFDEQNETDRSIMDLILIIDELARSVEGIKPHYAAVYAVKE